MSRLTPLWRRTAWSCLVLCGVLSVAPAVLANGAAAARHGLRAAGPVPLSNVELEGLDGRRDGALGAVRCGGDGKLQMTVGSVLVVVGALLLLIMVQGVSDEDEGPGKPSDPVESRVDQFPEVPR